jgi:hypothetical protein
MQHVLRIVLVASLFTWVSAPLVAEAQSPTRRVNAACKPTGKPAKDDKKKKKGGKTTKTTADEPPEDAAPAPAEEAAPAAPAAPAGGAKSDEEGRSLQRGERVEFDARLIQGQTAKAGAVYLFARVPTNLKSMVRERTTFREKIVRTVYPDQEDAP